jgi:N-acetylglucosaminyl-diphospho-decaprenol L-rhamnosyltransferase
MAQTLVNPSQENPASGKNVPVLAIVIPVFNQLAYTRGCIESLRVGGIADAQIIVINNASTDGTIEYLNANPQIQAAHNPANLGCGGAWTQGAKLSKSTWTVVMNNDVLIPRGCMEGLVDFAAKENFDIVSPAMCEGEMDYDLTAHAAELTGQMKDVRREGIAYGVCFMVHRRVFDAIGYFDSDPKLGGYEDDEYFRRARKAGFRLAVTGRAFLHHFGSITQKSIKADSGGKIKSLGDREYYRRKTGQTWLKRKIAQVRNGARDAWWRRSELSRFGRSLHEFRLGGNWHSE